MIIDIPLPHDHVLLAAMPISRGPYAVDDWLLVLHSLGRGDYVQRVTADGAIISQSKIVPTRDAALEIAWRLIVDQGNRNCSAVSCGGERGCE